MRSYALIRSLRVRLSAPLRKLAKLSRDDRGVTTEQVIWIAFLAGLALTVTGLFGPQILEAARNVTFR
ncbi:hypothetical protein ACIBKX_07715 [Streptomyces sp. NPDC050658]|uniref:hypothetical protein n=1 Tax=unclassified Streptomyces TaxID=2593676 RepID=UPI00343671AF